MLNVNKKFITFRAKTLDTDRRMYYIIVVRVSTLAIQVLKSKKEDRSYGRKAAQQKKAADT